MIKGDFTYCPHCATTLEERFVSGQIRRACPRGDFIQFHDPKVAVIALVLYQNQLLLTKRAVDPEKGKWALPGGYMDAGEMPEEALKRELIEEVNLPINVQNLLTIYPISNPVEDDTADETMMVKRGIVLVYRATVDEDAPSTLEAHDDVDEARWFAVDALPTEIAFESTRTLLGMWQDGEVK